MTYDLGPSRPEELFDLVDLANRVFRAGRPGDMGSEYPLVFEAPNAEHLFVARGDGRVVSHVGVCLRDAAILGARVRVASIGAVATDPDHRGHGLASRLMDMARAHAV
ncbi:MAG TPA: GNAT family N-acetyltransferase, partial [Armatimonadota bacterium]|nr:GNAT family N-acetyltransferase [Armatimonadota bacterium]